MAGRPLDLGAMELGTRGSFSDFGVSSCSLLFSKKRRLDVSALGTKIILEESSKRTAHQCKGILLSFSGVTYIAPFGQSLSQRKQD
jgi:hypothetical protein